MPWQRCAARGAKQRSRAVTGRLGPFSPRFRAHLNFFAQTRAKNPNEPNEPNESKRVTSTLFHRSTPTSTSTIFFLTTGFLPQCGPGPYIMLWKSSCTGVVVEVESKP